MEPPREPHLWQFWKQQSCCWCSQRLLVVACALRAVVGAGDESASAQTDPDAAGSGNRRMNPDAEIFLGAISNPSIASLAQHAGSFTSSERALQQVATNNQQLLEFPVLLEPDGDSTAYDAAIFLKLPGNWSGTKLRPCIWIVERAEQCMRMSMDDSTCSSRALWRSSVLSRFLGFEVPRPSFSRGSHLSSVAHNHSVCFYAGGGMYYEVLPWPANTPILLGRLVYFPVPKVRFIDTVVGIGVRTFLNPGWHREIQIQCTNCSRVNRITLAPIIPETRCTGVAQQALAAAVAAARDSEMPQANLQLHKSVPMALQAIIKGKGDGMAACIAPERSPCSGYADQAFSISLPKFDPQSADEVAFGFDSVSRLLVRERRRLFHHRSAICFYANEAIPHGWLIGFAALHMDRGDMQAFVVFVCFFGVVLPLICMVTALLHINKQERCKHHIQQLRDQVQREQLVDESNDRGLGQRLDGLPPSLVAAMTQMVRRPRRSRSSVSVDFVAILDDAYSEMIAHANHQWTVANAREFRAQLEEVQANARQARESHTLTGSALASGQVPAREGNSDGAQDSGAVGISDSMSSPLVTERSEEVGV